MHNVAHKEEDALCPLRPSAAIRRELRRGRAMIYGLACMTCASAMRAHSTLFHGYYACTIVYYLSWIFELIDPHPAPSLKFTAGAFSYSRTSSSVKSSHMFIIPLHHGVTDYRLRTTREFLITQQPSKICIHVLLKSRRRAHHRGHSFLSNNLQLCELEWGAI